MRRINGTGTTYLKITQPNTSGQSYATVWVMVLFFPPFSHFSALRPYPKTERRSQQWKQMRAQANRRKAS
jgi:hypothetical protein